MPNKYDKYRKVIITLHWLTAICIVVSYASIELRVFFDKGTDMRDSLKYTHFLIGLFILSLTIIRVIQRATSQAPSTSPQPPKWMQTSAKLGHMGLYVFLFAMPILGWLILSAEGKMISVLGWQLPSLIGVDKDIAHDIQEIHETLGTIGYGLIAAHIAMALYHHFIRKDSTLNHMRY